MVYVAVAKDIARKQLYNKKTILFEILNYVFKDR